MFVWNPRTGEDGQLTTTGPSVRGGVRNPVVDGGPWKLVPNYPLARFPPSVKQLLLVAVVLRRRWPNIRGALLPARLAGGRTWPLLPHIPLQAARQNEGQPRSYVAKE